MIMIQPLDGKWIMHRAEGTDSFEVTIPASVYDTLIKEGKIPDPYAGLNQYDAFGISDDTYDFEYNFTPDPEILSCSKVYLRFKGIDTNALVFLNGIQMGKAENMHRTYEFDVTGRLNRDENNVRVSIYSPIDYIKGRQKTNSLWGVSSTTDGFPHMRKAHYMFGWDWGPSLPDLGIWRDVELVGVKNARIESIYVKQKHIGEHVWVSFDTKLADISSKDLRVYVALTSPEGEKFEFSAAASGDKAVPEYEITDPVLWNVRGYGKPNLYQAEIILYDGDYPIDTRTMNIGLRTIEVCRDKDKDGDGEEFCFKVNGKKIFAMGANYIPEDQILPRRSEERTKALLESCAEANYNMIRVWGGGFYPDDYFYDICDRLGLLVWQDLAFACAVYSTEMDFCNNIRQEIMDNVKRLRNHPSLAMWCGNNEIESAILYWGIPITEEQKEGYLRIFEKLIPSVLKHCDPQTYYHPSSPSSGGNYNEPSAENKGDSHYWAVWHGLKPFSDFKKHSFRFCSEYGFESIPTLKTVRAFASRNDLNLMSPVMEAHQKCDDGNEKLLYYLAQMVHYPYSFEELIYATQLVQAEAVRMNVEHMRRNRGKCMGSLYWQVNDSNPVISWSSIDYFGRWKALHYYARRFYAPVLVSIDDSDKENLVINVSNETPEEFMGSVRWKVKRNDNVMVAQGTVNATVPPMSAMNIATLDSSMTGLNKSMYRNHYIEYSLVYNNKVMTSETCMLVLPKQFEYLDPELKVEVDTMGDMFRFAVDSKSFAKGVCVDFENFDCPLHLNWFDLHGDSVSLLVKKSRMPRAITPDELERDVRARSYYDLTKGGHYGTY